MSDRLAERMAAIAADMKVIERRLNRVALTLEGMKR